MSPALSALARSLNELQPPAPRKALGASIMGPYVQDAHILWVHVHATRAGPVGGTRRPTSSLGPGMHARATARLDLNRDADDGVAAPHA